MALNTTSRGNDEYLLVRVGGGASVHLVASWADEELHLAGAGRRPPTSLRPQPATPEDDDPRRYGLDADPAMLRAALWWPSTMCDKDWSRMLSTEAQAELERQEPAGRDTVPRPEKRGTRDITCSQCIQALIRRRPDGA
jgi:hypothetical protein